jgi:hypothetical protein
MHPIPMTSVHHRHVERKSRFFELATSSIR